MKKRNRERLTTWLVQLLAAAVFVSFMSMCVARWLRRPPYGGTVAGTVSSKNVVNVQTRYGTGTEYFLFVRTANGRIERIAISQQMYGQVGKGWKVRQERNTVTATSPDDARSLTSVITY
jgi:hypothetical protein